MYSVAAWTQQTSQRKVTIFTFDGEIEMSDIGTHVIVSCTAVDAKVTRLHAADVQY